MKDGMQGLKTYTGIVVTLLGLIMTALKVNITTDEIQPIVNAFFEFGGMVLAAYGRYKAQPKVNPVEQTIQNKENK